MISTNGRLAFLFLLLTFILIHHSGKATTLPEESVQMSSGPKTIFRHKHVGGFPSIIKTRNHLARYVTIVLHGQNILNIAEIEVLGWQQGEDTEFPPLNVAKGCRTRQSSTAANGISLASKAVDGNTDGVYNHESVSSTSLEMSPWLEVDLGRPHLISEIRLWNRRDGVENRLKDFDVVLSVDRAVSLAKIRSVNQAESSRTYGYMRLPAFVGFYLVLAWVLHIVIWRIRIPRRYPEAFFIIFAFSFFLGLMVNWMAPVRVQPVKDVWELLLVFVSYASLSIAYVFFYSTIRRENPDGIPVSSLSEASCRGHGCQEDGEFVGSSNHFSYEKTDDV